MKSFFCVKKFKNTESAQVWHFVDGSTCANVRECVRVFFYSTIGINPFLPTGQFLAPKLIILIKCLIDVLFFKVLF